MAKQGKRIKDLNQQVEKGHPYTIEEAVQLAKSTSKAAFDESVDASFNLGIDPRKADQMVRGTVTLPHGTGKTTRVAVFAEGAKADEAREAGADYVGLEDLAEKIEAGWTDFDRAVATPDSMRVVGRLGQILGPRGLMPNPKVGTVTDDLANVVAQIKAGQVEYRADKGGIVHLPIGRASFEVGALQENLKAAADALVRAKPAAAKGKYLRKVSISTTMGPGIQVDTSFARI
ncbi:MAG: 50S ribosomal protein L1 [Thiohalorhabdus sp.]|uniref:50S ribosomal protein L1 n=1 Tax=Thiohalorhabdus sp. TaxID=3094134 RepID=UPI003981378A